MKNTRNIYLNVIPYEEALEKYLAKLTEKNILVIKDEEIDTRDAAGRILTEPVFSKVSSPFFHSCAMDGAVTKAQWTIGASESTPKVLTQEQFKYVDTGDPLPKDFDCVIMIEDINELEDGSIEIISSASRWQHVRGMGEDLVANELIHSLGINLKPTDIGAALAGGVTKVRVSMKPKIGIIPTGTELVEPGCELKVGDIIEYNGSVLKAMVESWGAQGFLQPIQRDDFESLKETIKDAASKYDVIVVNAGSSAGSEDYTAKAVEALGNIYVHGVAIKPGRPVILGEVNNKAVIGLPGYPVSCVLTAELFLKPIIFKLLGRPMENLQEIRGILTRAVPSTIGSLEFVRVKLGVIKDEVYATPISRGAGLITSMTKADGILAVPANSEGISAGQRAPIKLLSSLDKIRNTILAIGSHDMALDIIDNIIKGKYPEMSLSSAHVGSMGGIQGINKGQCHLAGIHLFDPDSGGYNIPYLEKYLTNQSVHLVRLAKRSQGLILPKGNSHGITNIVDIARGKFYFVNRQRGSGTRILFDYLLKEQGISESMIEGYRWEEFTHTGVASAVKGGLAQCGMGVLSAAKALDLDFIPITWEEYDLVIPTELMETELIVRLLSIIKSSEFSRMLTDLEGYDLEGSGETLWRC
jgi:putative molybdopterin biosynthesis protein